MSKFQMRITRFALFMADQGSWTPFFYLLIATVFLVLGLGFFLVKFKLIVDASFAFVIYSPLIVVAIIASICKRTRDWGFERFEACFRLSVYTDEKKVLEKLRELAIWLGEELTIIDTTTDLKEKKNKVRFAKKRFWRIWRLAKAMGFPVFKSWKIHAQIKFIKVKF